MIGSPGRRSILSSVSIRRDLEVVCDMEAFLCWAWRGKAFAFAESCYLLICLIALFIASRYPLF